jgi:cyclophilin family peptidyl-prolyl cis-trans isomerase
MKNLFVSALFILTTVVPAGAQEAAKVNPKVVLDISKGKIVLELFADKAPETMKNFLAYMDVVDAISKVKTKTRGRYRDVPAKPVVIKSAKRLK